MHDLKGINYKMIPNTKWGAQPLLFVQKNPGWQSVLEPKSSPFRSWNLKVERKGITILASTTSSPLYLVDCDPPKCENFILFIVIADHCLARAGAPPEIHILWWKFLTMTILKRKISLLLHFILLKMACSFANLPQFTVVTAQSPWNVSHPTARLGARASKYDFITRRKVAFEPVATKCGAANGWEADSDSEENNLMTDLQCVLWVVQHCDLANFQKHPKACSGSRFSFRNTFVTLALLPFRMPKSMRAVKQLGGRLLTWVRVRYPLVLWQGNTKSPYINNVCIQTWT